MSTEHAKEALEAGAPPRKPDFDHEQWPEHPRQGSDEWPEAKKAEAKDFLDKMVEEYRQRRVERQAELKAKIARQDRINAREWEAIIEAGVIAHEGGVKLESLTRSQTYYNLRRDVRAQLHLKKQRGQA